MLFGRRRSGKGASQDIRDVVNGRQAERPMSRNSSLVQTVTELIPDWLGPIQPIFLWQPTDRFFILRVFQNLILKVRTTIWTVFLLSLRR